MEKIAIKCKSKEHGKEIIKYLESVGGSNVFGLCGCDVGYFYYTGQNNVIDESTYVPDGYIEKTLEELTETKKFPRRMLVWDDNEEKAVERTVLYILPFNAYFPVICVWQGQDVAFENGELIDTVKFKHAKELPSKKQEYIEEIENIKQRIKRVEEQIKEI